MEIERKFLPDLTNLPFDPADYPVGRSNRDICTAPVVRVRKDNDSYILTYKSKGLMVREEFNLPLTEEGVPASHRQGRRACDPEKRYVIPLKDT